MSAGADIEQGEDPGIPPRAEPKPSLSKTYKRVDGEEIADYGWVTDLEYFADDDAPVELIEETWERTAVRRFWHIPTSLYTCEIGNCEEDAAAWNEGPEGNWVQVCQEHLKAPDDDTVTLTRPLCVDGELSLTESETRTGRLA